jgi:GNAT superfamily N-acetyltransferase
MSRARQHQESSAAGWPALSVRPLSPGAAATRAGELAALTRAAYRGSDPLPGLPVPDGARETPRAVMAALGAGATVWAALDSGGALVGSARVLGWEVSRVSVHPGARGTGVARALLTAIERDAAVAGVPEVRLNAVIERCLPPRYARLGYHVVSHWPSPDKPLTEVTMSRRPDGPRARRLLPWGAAALLPHRGVRTWLLDGPDLLCVTALDTDPARVVREMAACYPGTLLAGVDVCDGSGLAFQRLPAARPAVLAHLMPRAAAATAFALWRFAPGHEVNMATVTREVSAA